MSAAALMCADPDCWRTRHYGPHFANVHDPAANLPAQGTPVIDVLAAAAPDELQGAARLARSLQTLRADEQPAYPAFRIKDWPELDPRDQAAAIAAALPWFRAARHAGLVP